MNVVTSNPGSNQNISFHPYRNATVGIVAFAALAAMLFAAIHKYDFSKCQERVYKFFSEQLPLRITIVSVIGILTMVLPYSYAYRVDYKTARLKEALVSNGEGAIFEKYKDILGKIAQHNASIFLGDETALQDELKAFPEDERNEIWQLVGQKVIEDPYANATKVLAKFARIFPGQEAKEGEEDLFCKDNVAAAKLHLESIALKHHISLNARLSTFMVNLASAVENILNGLGIADFLEPSDNPMLASFKANKLVTLINIFMVVSSVLIASLGPTRGGTISGLVFGGLSGTSIIWKSIRPLPPMLPGDPENWTQQICDGKLRPLALREEVLDEISETFKSNRHVLLLGQSRGGKTQTAKAFAKAVERGDYPHLAGKKVFKWNGSDLANHKPSSLGGGGSIIHDIEKAVGKNRDNIIIVIDEAHALFQNDSGLGAQLLSFLDEGSPFKHVIAITTDKDFQTYIVPKDPANAFANRFVPMKIQQMTQEETEAILVHNLRQSPSFPIVDEGILAKMATHGGASVPQPYTATNILKKAIEIVGLDPFKLEELAQKKPSKTVQSSKVSAGKLCHKPKGEVEVVDQGAVNELARRKKVYAELMRQKALIFQVTKAKFEAVVKGAALPANSSKRREIEMQIETLEAFEASLTADLKKRAGAEGFKLIIDDQVLQEAIEAMQKEMEERAKAKVDPVVVAAADPQREAEEVDDNPEDL